MLKKIGRGIPQGIKDWWRNRMHGTWNKLSRGAAEIAMIRTNAHGDGWRRKDKHQKNHDNHPHKCHKDR
jgi:hypothetical protein